MGPPVLFLGLSIGKPCEKDCVKVSALVQTTNILGQLARVCEIHLSLSGEPRTLRRTFGILARRFTVICLANIKFFAGHFARRGQTPSPDISGEFRVLCKWPKML